MTNPFSHQASTMKVATGQDPNSVETRNVGLPRVGPNYRSRYTNSACRKGCLHRLTKTIGRKKAPLAMLAAPHSSEKISSSLGVSSQPNKSKCHRCSLILMDKTNSSIRCAASFRPKVLPKLMKQCDQFNRSYPSLRTIL